MTKFSHIGTYMGIIFVDCNNNDTNKLIIVSKTVDIVNKDNNDKIISKYIYFWNITYIYSFLLYE